tara:strand:- start:1080 stop:1634 length:555 start_codon:yes stop_codon:yes gene_type:complete
VGVMEIKTERLTIKKIKKTDKKQLVDLIGDFRVSKTLSNVPYPYTDKDAEYWLNDVKNSKFKLNIFLDNILIGGVGLRNMDIDYYELGYWIGFKYWGKGYATEACYGLLNYVKKNTAFKYLKAYVYKENIASSNVLKKIGFRQTGDGKIFSLSRQENIPCINFEYCFRNSAKPAFNLESKSANF